MGKVWGGAAGSGQSTDPDGIAVTEDWGASGTLGLISPSAAGSAGHCQGLS